MQFVAQCNSDSCTGQLALTDLKATIRTYPLSLTATHLLCSGVFPMEGVMLLRRGMFGKRFKICR